MVTRGRTRSTALTETEISRVFADATRGWEPRPEQLQLLAKLSKSNARLILVEAPTGIGKSALAVVFGRLLGEQPAILTATKSLQNQYDRDFEVVKMMGRPNYTCAGKRPDLYRGDDAASPDHERRLGRWLAAGPASRLAL